MEAADTVQAALWALGRFDGGRISGDQTPFVDTEWLAPVMKLGMEDPDITRVFLGSSTARQAMAQQIGRYPEVENLFQRKLSAILEVIREPQKTQERMRGLEPADFSSRPVRSSIPMDVGGMDMA